MLGKFIALTGAHVTIDCGGIIHALPLSDKCVTYYNQVPGPISHLVPGDELEVDGQPAVALWVKKPLPIKHEAPTLGHSNPPPAAVTTPTPTPTPKASPPAPVKPSPPTPPKKGRGKNG